LISTELFPYETFPIRIEFGEKKNTTICHFQCQEHLDKYLERNKLDNRTTKIDYRDGEPTKPSQKRERNVEQKSEPKSNRGSSTVRKRKSSVDSPRNTAGTTKRKKK
jgi:hypothetical protein